MMWVRDRWDCSATAPHRVVVRSRIARAPRLLETERTALEATLGCRPARALAREALLHLTAPVAANAGLSAG
ncbi:MAG: hypothetical protein ACLR67_00260 [Eggerthella lenta]